MLSAAEVLVASRDSSAMRISCEGVLALAKIRCTASRRRVRCNSGVSLIGFSWGGGFEAAGTAACNTDQLRTYRSA